MAFQENGRAAEAMVAAGLSETQAEAMRRLAYDDLSKAADELAQHARAALDDDAPRPSVEQLHRRMSVMASILDVIGWTRPRHQDVLAARRLPDPAPPT
jgi:hypothetical protein